MKNRFDIKVLLVDDSKDFLKIKKDALCDFFVISTASTIAEALTAAQWDISVVVTDINMGKEGTPHYWTIYRRKGHISLSS